MKKVVNEIYKVQLLLPVEAILNAMIQASGVEMLEIIEKGGVSL